MTTIFADGRKTATQGAQTPTSPSYHAWQPPPPLWWPPSYLQHRGFGIPLLRIFIEPPALHTQDCQGDVIDSLAAGTMIVGQTQ
jgi:hypothetical protein